MKIKYKLNNYNLSITFIFKVESNTIKLGKYLRVKLGEKKTIFN